MSEQIQRAKVLKELEPLHSAWQDWQRAQESLRDSASLLNDPDPTIRELANEEREALSTTLSSYITDMFPSLLLPSTSSPTSSLSAIIDLKSGVGGDESSLFLGEVLRMYERIAAASGFTPEMVSKNDLEGSRWGVKDAILEVKGKGAYDMFRWESGVHRVQRVPATETSGRVHTSTIAVIVLPNSDPHAAEGEQDIVDEKDVRVDVMRSRGAGGQHVNKTESAVRLVHEPTGITVSMQESRSQHQNKARAWQILRARLLDRKMLEEAQKKRAARRNLVKGADRSEKIRTYNYPQDRVTDHRIGLTVNNIMGVLEGEGLVGIIEELKRENDAQAMEDLLSDVD
ncbi:hypothetical protein BOTBODRAFT_115421 [Botryobasidium botryosum FD-172 SS1]|uniref:Prokaryotic-type class I peptide chain release factors domain-containing protein n=1 Tax=Botryobasidium botryosum (strain FD-172 SS1) TaxID=930990 RepID=A0A067MGG5_BOTB1|nr:hypothetical protein BOTBODRAFT_115421 [Botryobasidium botryosum FD-172 SS1]